MKAFKNSLAKKLPHLVVVFFICASVAISESFAQDYGDALINGSFSDARTLLPILASDSASSEVCGLIFNGLVKYDKNINLIGDLAESWEIKDDGLVIIFHIRKDVHWHDGQKFSAKDVEFTYQKLISPDVRTPYSGDFERVKSLEVLDDYTIRVSYKEPFAPGLSSWSMPILPKHLLEKEDFNTTRFARHPIGTGPYKFKSWSAQNKIELVANPDYFEKRPFIDRQIYRVIPDQATIFLELQALGVDSATLTPLQFSRQTQNQFFNEYYRKFKLSSFSYTYLGYNLRNPLFNDKRVRQALNCAVDKEEIIKIVLLGLGEVATGPFVRESWAYNAKVEPAPFDQEQARRLLKEAGWLDTNHDGWLDKNGENFEFTIITNQGNDERIKIAEIIQRRLKDIGIKVKIKVVEWSVLLTEFLDKRNFDAILMGWSLGRDPDNYDIWHSSKTREGEFNFINYKNAEVDKLLEDARRRFNQEERKLDYQKIQQVLYEDQPYMFLYVSNSLPILSSRFRGVSPAPLGIGYNLIDWWVSSKEQRYIRMKE